MKTKINHYLSILLTAVMIIGLIPGFSVPAEAASSESGKCTEVLLGAGRVGNMQYGETNILSNIQTAKDAGIVEISTSGWTELVGNQFRLNIRDSGDNKIKLNMNNPVIKALAQSPTAEYKIAVKVIASCRDYHAKKVHYDRDGTRVWIYQNGSEKKYADSGTKNRDGSWADTGWKSFSNTSSLYINVKTYRNHGCGYSTVDPDSNDDYARAEVELYIRDKTAPKLISYGGSFSSDKSITVKENGINKLLVKLGTKNTSGAPEDYYYDFSAYNSGGAGNTAAANSREWVDMSFNFDKAVTAGTTTGNGGGIQQMGNEDYNNISKHTLFTNTLGTGYTNAGKNRELILQESASTLRGFVKSIRYCYFASYGDFNGNNAIPAGGGIESSSGYSYGSSLLDKIRAAGFHDAAGNPMTVGKINSSTNIFDRNRGGYDVIVDAVPPTYTRVGNGIYPDILTDVVLNKNDSVDFIVSFSEATITRRGWSDQNTYLLLDNGGKATYVGKSADGKRWTFRYNIPDGDTAAATLLKVIAIMNTAQGDPNGGKGPVTSGSSYSAYSYNFDGRTITDYVGNMMVERANEDPSKNIKQVNSFTGWAGITVDNTAPNFMFKYMPYGSGMMTYPEDENSWGQAVTVYTSATDPDVRVADYDSDYSSTNTMRPSKGIYRPDNTTGNAGSAVGLIFYTWTRNPEPPSTGQNFEAIKRYSLTGEQPSMVTGKIYAPSWKDYTLNMANNYYNILPPDESMTSAGDGVWYLHVWTADMTWDSARQLMQYKMAQSQQYNYDGTGNLYDAESMLRFKAEKIERNRLGDAPSYSKAWENVRASAYNDIYTETFRTWLADYDKSNADAMYTDAALRYAMEQAVEQVKADGTKIYNPGYDAHSLSDDDTSTKQIEIAKYITEHTPTAETAWDAVANSVYGTIFSESVIDWIEDKNENEPDSVVIGYDASASDINNIVKQYVAENVIYRAKDIELYTAETADAYKTEKINAYLSENPKTGEDNHDTTYTEAWEAVRKEVYETIYAEEFLEKLAAQIGETDVDEALDMDEMYTDETLAAAETANGGIIAYGGMILSYYDEASADEYETGKYSTELEKAIENYKEENKEQKLDQLGEPVYEDGQPVYEYPTDEEAEAAVEDEVNRAVRKDVYKTVYSTEFLYALTGTNNLTALDAALEEDDVYTDEAMIAGITAAEEQSYGDDESGKYTAESSISYRDSQIQQYITENTPDKDAAWEAVETRVEGDHDVDVYVVKEAVYKTVYLPSYIEALDASGFSRYSEDAHNYVFEHRAEALVYNSGYDKEVAANYKQSKITAYINANTKSYPANENKSYDDSWKEVRADVYQQVYTTQFLCWLAKIDSNANNKEEQLQNALQQDAMYSDEAMAYARAQATLTQAAYDDTSVWTLDMFSREDSNWTLDTARILLDNTAPTADSFGDIAGNNTIAASMIATISDANSGIDVSSIKYQWVKAGDELGIDWASATEINSTDVSDGFEGAEYGKATVSFTAETKDLVFESGEYILYVECTDTAGNKVLLNSGETTVKVNMNNVITCDFGPEGAETTYRKNVIPELTVNGMLITKVEYAVSSDITRPTEGYTEVTAVTADEDKMQYTYTLPELTVEDGMWYIHVLATGNTGDAQYFRGAYLVDNTAPEIYVNNTGLAMDGVSVNAQVSIIDTLSGSGEKAYYQILKKEESPALDDEGWLELDADRKVTLSGEPGIYYIHIKATDNAGNEIVAVSKAFEIKAYSDEPMELPEYSSQIITVSDGYGIANLILDSETKDGYRYSISTDGGGKWCNWLPYMSMTRIKLPSDYTAPGKLKVKFRAPDGTVGEPEDIITDAIVNEPIWATAEFDSTLKRRTGKTLTFIMTLSEDSEYRLIGTEEWQTGNFEVTENGVYSFELKKGTMTAATAFTVVVDIFDDIAPAAYLSYSEIAPTNSNVLVTVNCNEPVYVKNVALRLDGDGEETNAPAKMQYSFSKNGTAVFTVCDEAGNETVLTADVTNIDKTAPKVRITENYDKFYFTGSMASGVTLTVEKQSDNDEEFTVIGTDQSYSVDATENGTYSFTVNDAVGNVTKVSKIVENIVHDLPQYDLSYTYAVSGGEVSKDAPKKEDVKARVDFEELTDGRKLYFGTMPAADGSNELSKDGSGRYYTERTFSQSGKSTIVVSDSLRNVLRIPVTVEGIDRTAPSITMNAQQAVITPESRKLSELTADEIASLFGGYTVEDNAYAPEAIEVAVTRSDDIIKADEDKGDLSTPGSYKLIYTATDPAGNTSRAEQTLIVIPGDGLLVQASGAILSGAMSNTAIVPSNKITFAVDPQRMQAMFYGNGKQTVYNKSMRYDIYYVSGLYREGQLKTIASKLTAEELISKNFSVSFPKAGWYTIIIRNQERTREYTTFFVSSYKD